METKNINNPAMLSDAFGRPVVKGADVLPSEDPKYVVVRPYIMYLPNRDVIAYNHSTKVDISTDDLGNPVFPIQDGNEKWITLMISYNPDTDSVRFKVHAAQEAPLNSNIKRLRAPDGIGISETDVILCDIRLEPKFETEPLYEENIDYTRSEVANYLNPEHIPIEVYGPPLNQFYNLSQALEAINSGALDYRYVVREGTDYIRFRLWDISGCDMSEIPGEVKKEGSLFFVYDGSNKYLAIHRGSDIQKLVMTDPPPGFCGTCDINCDTDTCGWCEQYCDTACDTFTEHAGTCATSCEPALETTVCSNCENPCETGSMLTCDRYCQTQCEIRSQTPAGNCGACESACQIGQTP